MPNSVLNRQFIIDEVRTLLGASFVDVELSDEDIAKCGERAMRTYNRYRPQWSQDKLDVVAGVRKYHVDKPGIQGILDVDIFSDRNEFGEPFDPFVLSEKTGLGSYHDSYGSIDQRLHYLEDAKEVSSSESEWTQQWEVDPEDHTRKLFLYLRVQEGRPVKVGYLYSWHLTYSDTEATGLSWVPESDVDWFMDFTAAQAKQILGRQRGKFGGIVTAGGVNQNDGESTLSEGREDAERLTEVLKRRRRPLPPILD